MKKKIFLFSFVLFFNELPAICARLILSSVKYAGLILSLYVGSWWIKHTIRNTLRLYSDRAAHHRLYQTFIVLMVALVLYSPVIYFLRKWIF
ncbi:MAG: hypothetical protein PHW01_01030 [Patescibacteria group bacterium]|nr:hypothetical protein [Patescibacteria group bacterium]